MLCVQSLSIAAILKPCTHVVCAVVIDCSLHSSEVQNLFFDSFGVEYKSLGLSVQDMGVSGFQG